MLIYIRIIYLLKMSSEILYVRFVVNKIYILWLATGIVICFYIFWKTPTCDIKVLN